MKILVLLKKTPDTETKIQLSADKSALDHSQTKFIANPYDEFAIEEALQTKERNGSGEVIVASFGSDDTKELIIKGLAMGGDRGLLVNDEGLEQADSLTIAKVLAAVVKSEEVDLVFCGKQGIDADNMHLPTMLAELLDWPHINVVNKVSLDGNKAIVEREIEGGQVEVYEVELPVVLGANKSLNNPRYASLPGIMKAKRKPFDRKTVGDLGLDLTELQSGILTTVKGYEYPPEKPAGQIFQGEEIEVMVDKVVKLLRQEAKVL